VPRASQPVPPRLFTAYSFTSHSGDAVSVVDNPLHEVYQSVHLPYHNAFHVAVRGFL
jgi:hypothetical protein